MGCLRCVNNILGVCYAQKAGGCAYAVVRAGMRKIIESLHVQVVVSLLNFVFVPWLILEI